MFCCIWNLLFKVSDDIVINGEQSVVKTNMVSKFLSNPMWRLAAILDLLITETLDLNKNSTIVLSMVQNPKLDILHGHSNLFP